MHWPEKGLHNTEGTVAAALKRAAELGVTHIVVASNSGATAELLSGKVPELVCVTHHVGFTGPGEDEMEAQVRQKLQQQGVKVLTTTHLLAGVDRALRFKFQGVYPAEIVSSSLRLLGQGLKVCVEISVMALDAGLVPHGVEIIAVAGSGRGADTACVISPAHANNFFDTQVKEIICMPREK
jgi:uncharacterized protein